MDLTRLWGESPGPQDQFWLTWPIPIETCLNCHSPDLSRPQNRGFEFQKNKDLNWRSQGSLIIQIKFGIHIGNLVQKLTIYIYLLQKNTRYTFRYKNWLAQALPTGPRRAPEVRLHRRRPSRMDARAPRWLPMASPSVSMASPSVSMEYPWNIHGINGWRMTVIWGNLNLMKLPSLIWFGGYGYFWINYWTDCWLTTIVGPQAARMGPLAGGADLPFG